MCFKLLEKTWHPCAMSVAENCGTWTVFSLEMEAFREGVGSDHCVLCMELYVTLWCHVQVHHYCQGIYCLHLQLSWLTLQPWACHFAYSLTQKMLGSMSIQNAIQIMWLVIGFPPWQPRFDPRSGHVGCSGQISTGTGLFQVLWFFLPILISPNTPHSSFIRGWYKRPISVPSYQVDSVSPQQMEGEDAELLTDYTSSHLNIIFFRNRNIS
jgi:hypothetical protein